MTRFRPVPLILTLTGCLGVGISIYLTVVHYARLPLICATNGIVNCEQVLTSSYSKVAGLPVSVGGIVWFIVALVLALVALTRAAEPAWLQPAQVVWSLLALPAVIYLVGVEVLALGVICAWCTVLHALILLSLLLSIGRTPDLDRGQQAADDSSVSGAARRRVRA